MFINLDFAKRDRFKFINKEMKEIDKSIKTFEKQQLLIKNQREQCATKAKVRRIFWGV